MTIPTKEQALDTLDDLEKVFSEGLTVHGRDMFETLRTYIEGEKDSLGADEARKDVVVDEQLLNDVYDYLRQQRMFKQIPDSVFDYLWELSQDIATITAPALAYVPGIELFEKCLQCGGDGSYGRQIGPEEYEHAQCEECCAVGYIPHTPILDQQDATCTEKPENVCKDLQHAQEIADLRAKVEGMKQSHAGLDDYNHAGKSRVDGHNAALDAVIALIDGKGE